MIFGIGVDIIEVARVQRKLVREAHLKNIAKAVVIFEKSEPLKG